MNKVFWTKNMFCIGFSIRQVCCALLFFSFSFSFPFPFPFFSFPFFSFSCLFMSFPRFQLWWSSRVVNKVCIPNFIDIKRNLEVIHANRKQKSIKMTKLGGMIQIHEDLDSEMMSLKIWKKTKKGEEKSKHNIPKISLQKIASLYLLPLY